MREDAGGEKRPGRSSYPGSFFKSADGSDLGRPFRHRFLDRLVGIARDSGIHLAELRCLGNPGVVCPLGILRLDFDGVLKRLCADQLLEGAGGVFKSPLGIIGDPGADRLEALIQLAVRGSTASKLSLPIFWNSSFAF